MMEERAGEAVVTRIGFAERWLDRAKRQVTNGNLTRGVLTLVLADAEVHHALEVAGARPRHTSTRRVSGPLVALTVVVVVAAAVIAATQRPTPIQASVDPVPTLIKLNAPVGAWLNLVPTPRLGPGSTSTPAISRTPTVLAVRSSPVPRVVRVAAQPAPAPRLLSGPPTIAPSSAAPMAATMPAILPGVPVPPAVTPPAAITSPGLSAGDLIDLVLAAERALRSDPAYR